MEPPATEPRPQSSSSFLFFRFRNYLADARLLRGNDVAKKGAKSPRQAFGLGIDTPFRILYCPFSLPRGAMRRRATDPGQVPAMPCRHRARARESIHVKSVADSTRPCISPAFACRIPPRQE